MIPPSAHEAAKLLRLTDVADRLLVTAKNKDFPLLAIPVSDDRRGSSVPESRRFSDCRNCYGLGMLHSPGRNGDPWDEGVMCEACWGTGLIDESEPEEGTDYDMTFGR